MPVLEERDALAILEDIGGKLALSDFNIIEIGKSINLLLHNGEIITTSSVQEWKSYPSNQVITKHTIYNISRRYS